MREDGNGGREDLWERTQPVARPVAPAGPPARRRVADAVCEQLVRWGVRAVYGVPGDAVLPFLDAVARAPGLTFVGTRQEETAAFMAAAQAKLTGGVGVCTATSGPGFARLLVGLADAASDRVSVVALTGQVETDRLGTETKQYVDQQGMARPLALFSEVLAHPLAAPELVAAALRCAIARGGVGHLSVPADLWEAPCPAAVRPPEPFLRTLATSPPHVLEEAARLLSAAERPVLLLGAGARGAIAQALQLAEALPAAVVHTLAAAGWVPTSHPQSVGGLGEGGSEASTRLLERADLVLRVGATWWPEGFTPLHCRVLALDREPARVGTGSGASYGVVGDAAQVLGLLNERIHRRGRAAWHEEIQRERERWRRVLEEEVASPHAQGDERLHPGWVVRQIASVLPGSGMVSLDVGDHVLWFNRHFQGRGQDVLLSGSWRSMGFGLPAAMAAAGLLPGRAVLCLAGDGGFALAMAELTTAVALRLPLTVVVFNNGCLAMEKNQARVRGLEPVGVRLRNPDFAAYAGLCGARGYRVVRPDEVAPALKEALAAGEPALVDVQVSDLLVPGVRDAHLQAPPEHVMGSIPHGGAAAP